MRKVTREQYRAQLKQSIEKIDMAVQMGRADGYRICSTPDPASPHAEFWGLCSTGNQRFGTFRDLLVMVVFPSERLAKRCIAMTGGYVVSLAHVLASQRKQMEDKLKSLAKLEGIE